VVDTADQIIISDEFNHRIHICDDQGTCSVFGTEGSGLGQFSFPQGVAVDSQGRIIVGDWGNDRIQVCDTLGTCTAFGSTGVLTGQFNRPSGVSVSFTSLNDPDASNNAASAAITVTQPGTSTAEVNPAIDFHYRDVFGTSIGPIEVLTGDRMESFLSASGFDTRAGMEFSLASIPPGATINSVSLRLFTETSETLPSGAIDVYGYIGDGAASVNDVINPTDLIASFMGDPVSSLVPLDASYFQGLVNAAQSFVGVTLRHNGLGQALWHTTESGAATTPILNINYSLAPVAGFNTLFAGEAQDEGTDAFTINPATGETLTFTDIGESLTGLAVHPQTGFIYGSIARANAGSLDGNTLVIVERNDTQFTGQVTTRFLILPLTRKPACFTAGVAEVARTVIFTRLTWQRAQRQKWVSQG
jgi:hypothetical protein